MWKFAVESRLSWSNVSEPKFCCTYRHIFDTDAIEKSTFDQENRSSIRLKLFPLKRWKKRLLSNTENKTFFSHIDTRFKWNRLVRTTQMHLTNSPSKQNHRPIDAEEILWKSLCISFFFSLRRNLWEEIRFPWTMFTVWLRHPLTFSTNPIDNTKTNFIVDLKINSFIDEIWIRIIQWQIVSSFVYDDRIVFSIWFKPATFISLTLY